MTELAFAGWPLAAFEFYEGLEANNSKGYWLEHKDVYERAVRAPMDALVAELTEEFGEIRVFRPYRDTRFTADKSPYKTAIAATVGSAYVQVSAGGLRAGVGMRHMAADQLDRYRTAVAADRSGQRLEGVIEGLRGAGLDVWGADALKTAPRGYPKDHPRVELLRYKGVIAAKAWPVSPWIGTPAAKDNIVATLRTAAPLVEWLGTNVGATTEPELPRAVRRRKSDG